MNQTLKFALFVAITLQIFAPTPISAQESAGIGADMWVGHIKSRNLFIPHKNFCDSSTEAFVLVTTFGEGFCIEKNQRTAAEWEDARHTCVADNKRLPEPAEFKYACDAASSLGLSDMTGDWEWASNFAWLLSGTEGADDIVAAPVWGLSSCAHAAGMGNIGRYEGADGDTPASRTFRCVR